MGGITCLIVDGSLMISAPTAELQGERLLIFQPMPLDSRCFLHSGAGRPPCTASSTSPGPSAATGEWEETIYNGLITEQEHETRVHRERRGAGSSRALVISERGFTKWVAPPQHQTVESQVRMEIYIFFFFFKKIKRSGERTAQLVFLSCVLFYIHTWHKLSPRNRFERKLNSTWNGNNLNKGLHTQTKGLKNAFKKKRASSIEKDESLWGVTGNVNKYIFVSIFIHFLNPLLLRSGWQGVPEPSWRFVTG